MSGPQRKVRIACSQQKAYVYDIEDVRFLRVQHHICGLLVGTLPQVGQQNVFLGLPLVLLPEEVVLLVRNNLAILVDDPRAHVGATPEQSASYHSLRTHAIDTQRSEKVRLDQERRTAMELKYAAQIAAGKSSKGKVRAEQAKAKVAQKTASATEGVGQVAQKEQEGMEEDTLRKTEGSTSSLSSFEILVPDLEDDGTTPKPPPARAPRPTADLSSMPYTIVIQPSSTDLPWYDAGAASYETLEAAKAAGVWHYPTTPLQESRCRVFEDLWRKGYFMGGGLRFGGDFLIYPGDSLRYHSHFTLTVLASPSSPIMPLDLVSYGRLATAVKKAHLLGTWNSDTQEAEYVSLEWAAFG